MIIGLDLDGTVYAHPKFFAELIEKLDSDYNVFYCISSHGIDEWPSDMDRLYALGIPAHLISSALMNPVRHGDLSIKGRAADQCDFVFDDDQRLQAHTKTPVFAPLK